MSNSSNWYRIRMSRSKSIVINRINYSRVLNRSKRRLDRSNQSVEGVLKKISM